MEESRYTPCDGSLSLVEVHESQTDNNHGGSAALSLSETLSDSNEAQSSTHQRYAHITVQGAARMHAGNSYIGQQINYCGSDIIFRSHEPAKRTRFPGDELAFLQYCKSASANVWMDF